MSSRPGATLAHPVEGRGKTVLVVFGTRPEAIKLAPVIRELERRPELNTVVCTTGQHREMLAQMLKVFGLEPHCDLAVMKPGQTLTEVTTAIMTGMDDLLKQLAPVHAVLVQGDTTTAFAAALEAFYHRIPVGHVEAGLRTLDKYNPFPEEINRRLVSPIADLHFAPTEWARNNLVSEGFSEERILVTGNTVIDALLYMQSEICRNPAMVPDLGLGELGENLIVVTAHRRENFGDGLQQICEAIAKLARCRADIQIVYPVHLNPNVSGPVRELLADLDNVNLLPPLDYVSFVALMARARILLTDSGGIQEEGPALGKPVLVMREVSERPEAIIAGSARLVGTDAQKIVSAVSTLLDDPSEYESMINRPNPFGDGTAAVRIVDALERTLLGRERASSR